jgi:hypothetical protein
MNFEPPADLELALPEGELNVREEPAVLDGLNFPVFVAGRADEVALHVVRPRWAVGAMATQLVARRLLAELRAERGFAYRVVSAEAPLTRRTTATTIVSDARAEHAAAAGAVMSQVLHDLAADGCAEHELAEIRQESERAYADPRSLPGFLRGNAASVLGMQDRLHIDAHLAEQRAVTSASIAACVADMTRTALVSAPPPASAPAGFTDYPRGLSPRVGGRRHQWRPAAKHAAASAGAHVSPQGVSVVFAEGREVTVEFADAPLMVIVDDARRALWARDGGYVEIDREAFANGDELIDAVDRGIPMERVRVDRDRRRAREAVRVQVAVLVDARRRLVGSLALISLFIIVALVGQPQTGTGLLFSGVALTSLTWRTVRMKLRPVSVGTITTIVQRVLEAGETLELLATGKLQGQAVGLIILTDRRFVFAQGGTVQVSVTRADVTRAQSRRLSSTLLVHAPERTMRFDYVTRQNRADVARALNAPAVRRG